MENNDYNIKNLENEFSLSDQKNKLNELKSQIEKKYIDLFKDKASEIKKFLDLVFNDKLS
jgi:hypothetical protein